MDNRLLEIANYQGEGYQPLISFGEWRVAALRYLEKLEPDQLSEMERHTATDEVFILVEGSGIIFIGGNQSHPTGIHSFIMKNGEIYNVKRNTWHTISLSKAAHVIIVENDNTDTINSEIAELSQNAREQIRSLAIEYMVQNEKLYTIKQK
ncbi:MAG: cupin domain-containing protein [Anaerolineaceae bacterium]|nr:cupin domain-containing protein [Anaerolineaceae bacterium]